MGHKVFKNVPSKICGRQPLKNLKGYDPPKGNHTLSNFLKGCLPPIAPVIIGLGIELVVN